MKGTDKNKTQGRRNIRQEMLHLMLSGSTLALIAALLLLAAGFFAIYDTLTDRTARLGRETVGQAVDTGAWQVQEKISGIAKSRAGEIELYLDSIRRDTQDLSALMTGIASTSKPVAGASLPDPRRQPIRVGEAYIHYGNNLKEEGARQAKAAQIARDAQAAPFIESRARWSYWDSSTAIFIASADDYMLCAQSYPGHEQMDFTPEYLESFDPQSRPWYVAAMENLEKKEPVFTDVYVGVDDGLASISCAQAYYEKGRPAGAVGIGCTLESVSRLVAQSTVGRSGFSIVLDTKGKVIFSGRNWGELAARLEAGDVRQSGEGTLAEAARAMVAGERGFASVRVDGGEYLLAYEPLPSVGWSFGTLISREEAVLPLREPRNKLLGEIGSFDKALYGKLTDLGERTVLLLLATGLLILALSLRLSRRFVEPLYAIGAGVQEIAGGDLDRKIEVHTGDEIERLAEGVNAMTGQMKLYLQDLQQATAERQRTATELEMAARIQAGMLPDVAALAGRKEYDLAAAMYTAKEMGGDFYDAYLLDDRHLALTMADVSGKGIGAALFMMVAKTMLKNTMLSAAADYAKGREPDFGILMGEANRHLCEGNEKEMFVTVFFAVLDFYAGTLSYVSAGHNPPLLGGRGKWEYLRQKKKGVMLGILEGVSYQQQKLQLQPGDSIFLYTDGVTEAMEEGGGFYTEKRLQETLEEARPEDMAGLLARVREDVAAYVGTAPQSDDMTMMGLKFMGEGTAHNLKK